MINKTHRLRIYGLLGENIVFALGTPLLSSRKNPFRKNYLIEVNINTVDDVIKSYTILRLHDSYMDDEENTDLFS
jgi:hypothetical protein